MPSPHFLTFTGNPLAETTFEFADWTAGATQRAASAEFQVGGKGINVTKMLRRLGARTTALTFLGGVSGERCRAWLAGQGFDLAAFGTGGATREGLVVRSPGRPETTFLGPDSPPDAAAWQIAADWLGRAHEETLAADGRAVFALCGSAPGWASGASAPFRTALEDWIGSGLPYCADTYGAPLEWSVEREVALVKVNADEFRGLLRAAPGSAVDALLEKALGRWPVKAWVVTDGPRPVWFATKDAAPRWLEPPRIAEVSATGSGDVMMACLLESLYARGLELDDAVDWAIPRAAANAAHPGIAEFEDPQC
ncbi:tagatose-6-phosphate kinase [mine drainage metagenome]|uniref:Tagatose-6-phosphate kinase n=1 Tax=mine drainage metagenome TaxID=410659 RepID=A0A1J5TCW3_9ZZZZ